MAEQSKTKSLDAVTATGVGTRISSGAANSLFTMQVIITGAPTAAKVDLEGSLDNGTTFSRFATWDSASGRVTGDAITASGWAFDTVRANLVTLTGGSSPTVTAYIMAKPEGAGGTFLDNGEPIGPSNPLSVIVMPESLLSTVTAAAAATAGTGWVPNDTVTPSGGEYATPALLTVTHTKAITAAVVSGGTGGTPGAVTVTGTTGTGTKFQATGTISAGGVLTGPLTVTVAGDYTVNPTSIAIEPVTGGSLSGATVILTMGILTLAVTTAGLYRNVPTNPAGQLSTSRSGTGATFTLTTAAATGTQETVILGAGEAHVGTVSERYILGSGTLTRPANATPYSIGDAMTDTGGAATTVTMGDLNDAPISIEAIRIKTSDTGPGTAGASFECWIYDAATTPATDNTAFTSSYIGRVGKFAGSWEATSDGSVITMVAAVGSRRISTPISGAKTLNLTFKTLTAITPSGNSTVFTIAVEGFQGRA